jgi:undecaprenyl diphosphate synthase
MDLDPKKLPRHIAVIMDGNGRWAQERGLPRVEGHRVGSEVVDEIVTECRDLSVRYLTLYAFSMENWARPKDEVDTLMALLREFLISKKKKLLDNDIALRSIGDIARLPHEVSDVLLETQDQTAPCQSMTLTLALSYGARDEIVRAIRRYIVNHKQTSLRESELTQNEFSSCLDTHFLPDPDLVIRTGGETRTSNFLVWQAAYAEYIFVPTFWPDFHRENLINTLQQYQQRERRFGQTSDQVQGS